MNFHTPPIDNQSIDKWKARASGASTRTLVLCACVLIRQGSILPSAVDSKPRKADFQSSSKPPGAQALLFHTQSLIFEPAPRVSTPSQHTFPQHLSIIQASKPLAVAEDAPKRDPEHRSSRTLLATPECKYTAGGAIRRSSNSRRTGMRLLCFPIGRTRPKGSTWEAVGCGQDGGMSKRVGLTKYRWVQLRSCMMMDDAS